MTIGLARDFWEIGARPGDMVANLMFTFRSAHGIERFERLPLSPIFINQGTDDLPAFCSKIVEEFAEGRHPVAHASATQGASA